MNLAERNADLQLLNRLYLRCAADRGSVVFVNGPVGSGKTAMLSAFAERAVENGALFVSITASASEQHHRFGLADQLVTALRAAGMKADPFVAGDIGGPAPGDGALGTGPVPLGLLQRICRSVCEFAEQHSPLVLGIDDVHFADAASLEVLSYLVRRIDSSAVMIVMNECTGHDRELVTLHAETLHLPYCHGIRLTRLTVMGVAAQLRDRLGSAPSYHEVELWTRVSGGNPLLLHALIDDRTTDGTEPGEPEPGESYRYAVVRCLHRCPPDMLVAARALAVLGDAATKSLIGELVGGDGILVNGSLGALHAAGLLTATRFRHEQAQLAVLADVPAGELSEMHGRAAELLHEGGASAVAVARQLMAAHDSVRTPWRVEILREAAHEAMVSGEVAAAVGYLRHASGICTDPAQEAQVTAELADAQWHIDPAKATRHLDQLIRMVRFGLLTGPEALVPVKHLIWWGEFTRADDLLKRIENQQDHEPAPVTTGPGRAGVRLVRLALSFCAPDLARDPRDVTGDPLDAMAAGAGAGPLTALTFLNLSTDGGGDGEEVQGADQVLRATRAGSPLAATILALILLIQTDRLDDAVSWSDRLLEQRWIERVPMRRAMLETVRSAAALRRGEALEAGASARTVLQLVAPASWGVAVGLPLALAIRSGTELGAFDSVLSVLNVPVPAGMFDTPFALPYLQALGRYHLAVGRPHTALTHFRSCGDLMRKWRIDAPHLVDWRDDAAAALVAMGRVQEARSLMEEQLLRRNGSRVPDHFRDRAARSHGTRPPAAHTRPHRWEAPGLGSGPGSSLGGAGAQTTATVDHGGEESFPVLVELTEAERRVAALAASGCTNREIAGRLFITMSTVEQHLTKIYRKLRVRGRNDLPSALQVHGRPSCLPNGR
ncbi:AAA family ATPase [Streptomyces sp. NPDC005955]|uniref:helix-turn-helix transcriptional regulator n=1 Tax=Streptomyces sp. NPDC005955 TaxID=3364738 RepID=UPI0036AD8ABD